MIYQLMKSLNSFLIGLGIAGAVVTTVTAAPRTPTPGSEVYIVQADDWLSKLAQKYYGDALAYPAIVEATNAKAAEDTTFAPITNPDVIEVGQKLWIPTHHGRWLVTGGGNSHVKVWEIAEGK